MEPSVQKSEDKFLGQPVQQIRDCALQTVSNWNPFQKVRQPLFPADFPRQRIHNCWAPIRDFTLEWDEIRLLARRLTAEFPRRVRMVSRDRAAFVLFTSAIVFVVIFIFCSFSQKFNIINAQRPSVRMFYFRNYSLDVGEIWLCLTNLVLFLYRSTTSVCLILYIMIFSTTVFHANKWQYCIA
jgi:hypothetical protein